MQKYESDPCMICIEVTLGSRQSPFGGPSPSKVCFIRCSFWRGSCVSKIHKLRSINISGARWNIKRRGGRNWMLTTGELSRTRTLWVREWKQVGIAMKYRKRENICVVLFTTQIGDQWQDLQSLYLAWWRFQDTLGFFHPPTRGLPLNNPTEIESCTKPTSIHHISNLLLFLRTISSCFAPRGGLRRWKKKGGQPFLHVLFRAQWILYRGFLR